MVDIVSDKEWKNAPPGTYGIGRPTSKGLACVYLTDDEDRAIEQAKKGDEIHRKNEDGTWSKLWLRYKIDENGNHYDSYVNP